MKKFTLIQKIRNKIRIKGSADLNISSNAKIVNCDISIKGENNKFLIEDGATVRYTQIEILGDNCVIEIGKNSIIGHGCYLSAKSGKKLLIGNKCMLSRNVKIMTSDGHPVYKNTKIINHSKDTVVKDHVWLADNVTILKGVTIKENSIVGINATVTKDVTSGVIVAGNPAKVVKEGINWNE